MTRRGTRAAWGAAACASAMWTAWAAAVPANNELPAGADIAIRLKTKLASNSSKPKDPFEALVIAPVLAGERIALPAGAVLRGSVREVRAGQPNERAVLDLDFSELVLAGGKTARLAAKAASVDNARETVDADGKIVGILASETLSGKMDQGLAKISERYSDLAEILRAAKGAVVKAAEGDIVYEPGVEMVVKLTQPLAVPAHTTAGPQLDPIESETELAELVTGQPFQTIAEKPPKPSDITNLMFIGSEVQLTAAFTAAGWATAAAVNAKTKLETARAIIEARGYKEAPVSTLLLDGQKPDLVFQKQNNTFAQRHHLRIWRRPVLFEGKPVWVCAATHDIGIDFSQESRTFTHKIDPQIDRERAKVVNDLLLTEQVKSLALVGRPEVPPHTRNATGDDIETDAAMAVLVFR